MLLETIKNNVKSVVGTIGVVTSIAGAAIYVNTNYAHASDVNKILQNQEKQLNLYERSQRNSTLFQLEYYNDQLQRLQLEKRQSELVFSARPLTQQRFTVRTPQEIQAEIDDVKRRRDLIRQSITN